MFLNRPELREAGGGVWETTGPLVFSSLTAEAPPGICVPEGFQTDFGFIPPPARGWIVPSSAATGPAVIYAWLRSVGFPRGTAMAVFQEALEANEVPRDRRSLFLLSL